MGFQVAFESQNVFAQSNLSRQRVPGGWSSSGKSATGQFGVYARNDEHRSIGRAQNPRWCTGLYQLSSLRYVGVAVETSKSKRYIILVISKCEVLVAQLQIVAQT